VQKVTADVSLHATQGIDGYLTWRLFRLMVKKRGRNLRAGKPISGPKSGSTGTACIACAAPSDTPKAA
jgi:hypothetical protein